jgi:predicted dehydrogenase
MTKVGIIGCGNISRFHHEGYVRAGAQIAHVCDVREDAARTVAERYGAKASTDWRAVVADPDVALLSVLTPASLHREICLAAIAAGKGVVCEKTLSDSAESALAIVRAAEAAGTFFATAFMKRHLPAARLAKTMLAEMGPVISIHARTWQPFASLWDDPVPEIFTQKPSPVIKGYGGGVLVCGGSHILDLICWYAGVPTRVAGSVTVREPFDFDTEAHAMLWLPDGGIAHLETFWHPFEHVGRFNDGWDERLEINTAKGRLDLYTVYWDRPERNGALLVHTDARSGTVTEHRFPPSNPFDLQMADLLRRFEEGAPGAPTARDGYVVDLLLASIAEASRTSSVVEVVAAV